MYYTFTEENLKHFSGQNGIMNLAVWDYYSKANPSRSRNLIIL